MKIYLNSLFRTDEWFSKRIGIKTKNMKQVDRDRWKRIQYRLEYGV